MHDRHTNKTTQVPYEIMLPLHNYVLSNLKDVFWDLLLWLVDLVKNKLHTPRNVHMSWTLTDQPFDIYQHLAMCESIDQLNTTAAVSGTTICSIPWSVV